MMKAMLNASLLVLFTVAILLWVRRITRALETVTKVPLVHVTHGHSATRARLTIVIPARNEEKNLPCCLKSIEGQLDENTTCLVINDRSTDQTETILKKWGYTEIQALPLPKKSYINLHQPPPNNWTGKNNALCAAFGYLESDWLLFTDADTLHNPGGIHSALDHAIKNQLALLSLIPRCLTASFAERLIQPSAMAMMGLWFSLNRVNHANRPDHFANGQFLMIQKKLYQQLGGHAGVADCFLEDFALMKKAKGAGAKVACHQGQEIYGTRMYQTVKEIWRGWRRIYLHASEGSSIDLLKHFVELCIASILPNAGILILIFAPQPESPLHTLTMIFASLWTVIAASTAIGTYQTLRAPRRYALLHPLAALIVAGILLDAIRVSFLQLETKWRE